MMVTITFPFYERHDKVGHLSPAFIVITPPLNRTLIH